MEYASASSDPEDVAEFRAGFREWLRDNATMLDEWRGRHYPACQVPTLEQEMEHGGRLMALLWQAGWGRAGWPVEAGGSGGGSALRAVLLDELWGHDVDVPHQYEALEVMAPPLLDMRPDLVKAHLPAFVSGKECWVQAFSEPEAGSATVWGDRTHLRAPVASVRPARCGVGRLTRVGSRADPRHGCPAARRLPPTHRDRSVATSCRGHCDQGDGVTR